jgi:N-acyl-L-homoserine lactone synthetase
MLRDVFPFLLKDDEAIESATIWECSRICAAAKNEQLERSNGVSFVLAKLLVGIGDVARLVGLTQIVTVLMHGFSGSWRLLGANRKFSARLAK